MGAISELQTAKCKSTPVKEVEIIMAFFEQFWAFACLRFRLISYLPNRLTSSKNQDQIPEKSSSKITEQST
jgi:hypothetical protein